MEIKAVLRRYRVAPRKVRLVVDLIRGLDVEKALGQLEFVNKKSALAVKKLLNSAIANAVNNFSLERNNLFIKSSFVDQGQVLKRWMPRAHGRASRIKKYTSHVTLILDEKVPSKVVKADAKKDSKDKKIKTEKLSLDKIKKASIKKDSGHTDTKGPKITKQAKQVNNKSFIRKAGDK